MSAYSTKHNSVVDTRGITNQKGQLATLSWCMCDVGQPSESQCTGKASECQSYYRELLKISIFYTSETILSNTEDISERSN